MDDIPVTNKASGEEESWTNKTLETGAAAVQVYLTVLCLVLTYQALALTFPTFTVGATPYIR
jgi:hypothetical protein